MTCPHFRCGVGTRNDKKHQSVSTISNHRKFLQHRWNRTPLQELSYETNTHYSMQGKYWSPNQFPKRENWHIDISPTHYFHSYGLLWLTSQVLIPNGDYCILRVTGPTSLVNYLKQKKVQLPYVRVDPVHCLIWYWPIYIIRLFI